MNFAKQYFWIKQNLHEAHHNTLPSFIFTKVYFRCIWDSYGIQRRRTITQLEYCIMLQRTRYSVFGVWVHLKCAVEQEVRVRTVQTEFVLLSVFMNIFLATKRQHWNIVKGELAYICKIDGIYQISSFKTETSQVPEGVLISFYIKCTNHRKLSWVNCVSWILYIWLNF